jgi:alpha-tubulin suppressor-like RCC1 family protein
MSLMRVRKGVFRSIPLRSFLGGLLVGVGMLLASAPSALATSSIASSWGDNTYGELGVGREGGEYSSKVPVAVSGLSTVKSVAAGGADGLALLENGTVVAWGNNGAGELGDGTTTQRSMPVKVSGLSGVTAIAAGESHSLALLSNGTVMAWGRNDWGQLGNGSITGPETCSEFLACSTTPEVVSGLSGVKAIAAGHNFNLALLSNGTVMAWGQNTWGQLGDGTSTGPETCAESLPCSATPVAVSGLSGVKSVAASGGDGLALLENGTVTDWGYGNGGQLGNGSTTQSDVPVAVSGLSTVTAIAGGGGHGLALLSDGTVRAWGYNATGQLGNGMTSNSDVPVTVSGLSGVTAVAGGEYHSLALLSNGTMMAWGWDLLWQLGNSTAEDESLVPVPVSGVSGVTAIAAGNGQSFAAGGQPVPSPQVVKVQPNDGLPAGGTSVTITGLNFTGATAVKFGSTNAASFKVDSATSITAVSPPGTGAVHITVTTPEGTSYTSHRDLFGYGPIVTRIEPNSGPAAGGTSVTISGTGLGGATAVKFGATEATSFKVESETEIIAVSPAGTGTVDVTVETLGAVSPTSSADQFSYGGGPVIESESASNVTEHGATLEGRINLQGAGQTTYDFEYGTSTSYGSSAPMPPGVVGGGGGGITCGLPCGNGPPRSVSVNVTGLEPDTTYHYRLVATNVRGTDRAPDATFTTQPAALPEAPVTESCSGPILAGHGQKMCGTVNPHTSAKTEYHFAYKDGSSCGGGSATPVGLVEGQNVKVSIEVLDLQPNTEYSYCLVATNEDGSTVGGAVTFTTEPVEPGIGGVSAADITDDNATLEAQIAPQNTETEYEIVLVDPCPAPMECIVDVSLASGKIPATTAHETVKVELANKEHLNLEPDTTYEYWIIAKNSHAETAEVHKTFKTLKTPAIDSESYTGLTEHDATLQAQINPEGQSVRYQFQIVKIPSEYLPEMACPSGPGTALCLGSPATPGALPLGFIATGSADESVSLDLAAAGVTLEPETTYHYRVIAVSSPLTEDTIQWEGPQVYGADQTFTTPGPPNTGGSQKTTQTAATQTVTGTPTGHGTTNTTPPKPKVLTNKQKLAKALKACERKPKKQRASCEKQAHRKYGTSGKKASRKRKKK